MNSRPLVLAKKAEEAKLLPCCGAPDAWSHKEDCRHAWRNKNAPLDATYYQFEEGKIVAPESSKTGYLVQKNGSLRLGGVFHTPDGQEQVVKLRKPNKAERKKMRKERHARRAAHIYIPDSSDSSVEESQGSSSNSSETESNSQ